MADDSQQARGAQLRLKDAAEYAANLLSLERQILQINREQSKTSKEYSSNVQNLEKELSKSYEEQKDNLLKQQGIIDSILSIQEDIVSSQGELKTYAQAQFMGARGALETHIKTMAVKEEQLSLEKEIISERKKQEDESKSQLGVFVQYLGKFGEFFGLQQKSYTWLKKTFDFGPKLLVVYSSLLALFFTAFSKFKEIDKSLADFRISMGMGRDDVERITRETKLLAAEFAHIGVTAEGVLAATRALGLEFGGVRKISKDLAETASILKSQLGVSEEITAGFLRNISALGQSTARVQKDMAWVAKHLATAAGVPLNLVMQDVAKMSDNALALVSKMPMEIVKTATAARALGTTLNKMAEAGSSLLQFTESVQAEMEASVLIGRSVNFQLARELMYRGQIEEATEELLRLAKEVNFEGLDFFQMRAWATAAGVSVDEMMKMLQAQKQLEDARNIPGLQKEVALIERMRRLRDEDLKDEALQTKLSVERMANQERMAALQQQWNQLIVEATVVLFPFIEGFLKILTYALKLGPALSVLVPLLGAIATGVGLTGKILAAVNAISGFVNKISITIALAAFNGNKLYKVFAMVFSGFRSFFGVFSKFSFLTPFLKVIPIVGWVITAFQLIYNFSRRFEEFVGEDGYIIGGLKAIGFALYDTLLAPFKGIWDWLMKRFGANSPSELGLQIVNGLRAVQGIIFDVLSYPFRKFFSWVLDKIPFMGGLAEKIRGGATGQLRVGGSLEQTAEKPSLISAKVIADSPAGTSPPLVKTVVSDEDKEERNNELAKLSDILNGIKELNSNLLSGKIAIYMDGQLLSNTLARQTAFKGGYGTSDVTIG